MSLKKKTTTLTLALLKLMDDLGFISRLGHAARYSTRMIKMATMQWDKLGMEFQCSDGEKQT